MTPQELLSLLAPPFAACLLFVAIHQGFGMHVLRRGVIFVDLALAQMSALGSTVAFALGHDPTGTSGLAYTLLFSTAGAALLTLGRTLPRDIQAEAYIGILYVVTTAATLIVVDRSPQGAEHVKQILIGSILAVSSGDLPKLVLLYGMVAVFLWLARTPLERASDPAAASDTPRKAMWDFLFYAAFGVVVTSSVAVAGVLLVFCFLIIPSIIGTLFSRRAPAALVVGAVSGAAASAIGLGTSLAWDLPAGAAMVMAFAFVLVVACVVHGLASVCAKKRKARLRGFARAISAGALAVIAAAALWLVAMPRADQPLLDLLEAASGMDARRFLTPEEHVVYAEALRSAGLRRGQATDFTQQERASRWQGNGLSDEEVRRLGMYQQAFNEMARGEEFVLRQLTARARERQRRVEAPIALAMCVAGLLLLLWSSGWHAARLRTTASHGSSRSASPSSLA
jgi:zinc/manganese transport system permease protein